MANEQYTKYNLIVLIDGSLLGALRFGGGIQ
jgi:hypothetical protein